MTAEEFMALLRASNPIWHETEFSGDPPRWIFRGHRNAHWRLTPRSWRTAGEWNPLASLITKLGSALVRGADNINLGSSLHMALAWTHAERVVVNEFRKIGWRMGFEVEEPDSSPLALTLKVSATPPCTGVRLAPSAALQKPD